MERSQILLLAIAAPVGLAILIYTLVFVVQSSGPANIVILETESSWTDNSAVVTGRIINSGHSKSNPVILEISVEDANRVSLGTTTTAPNPSVVEPGMEVTFSKDIGHILGSYQGAYTYTVTILSE